MLAARSVHPSTPESLSLRRVQPAIPVLKSTHSTVMLNNTYEFYLYHVLLTLLEAHYYGRLTSN